MRVADNVIIIIIKIIVVVSSSIVIIMLQTVATHRPVEAQTDLYFGSSDRKSSAVLRLSDGGGSKQ